MARKGVSICGLEKQYEGLHRVYLQLAAREQEIREGMDDARPGPCTMINGVDFAAALSPLPRSMPLKTDSDANRFAMLVWKMLDACESGSVGGDACRMDDVIFAAADDAKEEGHSFSPRRFEHLLGLTLALSNHGVESWLQRGDPHNVRVIFKSLGDGWKPLLSPGASSQKEKVLAAGVSTELHQFAIEACEALQRQLASDREGKISFNFIAKPRAPRQPREPKATPAVPAATIIDAAVSEQEARELRAFAAHLSEQVRRTPHSEKGAAATALELHRGSAAGGALVRALGLGKDLRKVELSGAQLLTLLPALPKTVHPVAIRSWSKVVCMQGTRPNIYAWAGFMSVALTLVAASGALKLKVTSRVVGCGIPSYVGGEDAFDDYLTASGSTEFNAWKKRKRDEEMGLHVAKFRAALAARTHL